jgi:hypothetical protein
MPNTSTNTGKKTWKSFSQSRACTTRAHKRNNFKVAKALSSSWSMQNEDVRFEVSEDVKRTWNGGVVVCGGATLH